MLQLARYFWLVDALRDVLLMRNVDLLSSL